MGKKTSTTKTAAPEKRAAKTKPAEGKADVIAPPPTKAAAAKSKRTATAAKPAKKRVARPSFTQDDVALRAYFISERRQAEGLSGDAHQDWIEAERQLVAESASGKKAKTKAS